MQFGISMFPTDQAIPPADLAREVEARGFESLWFPEHSHIPVSRRTPWGGVKNAKPLPEYYSRTLDQFVALAAAAAVTTTLKLGTGITLVPQRDPIWLAKQVASVDVISGGRALFGIGYGWNREEMADHGVAYLQRRAILRENVLAMKELWTKDVASFEGEHVAFEPSWAWPKPVQRPHPPIILGGALGPRTIADIVEFCDGWMPIAGRHDLFSDIESSSGCKGCRAAKYTRVECERSGIEPVELEWYAEVGVSRVVISIPPRTADDVLPRLDRLTDWSGSSGRRFPRTRSPSISSFCIWSIGCAFFGVAVEPKAGCDHAARTWRVADGEGGIVREREAIPGFPRGTVENRGALTWPVGCLLSAVCALLSAVRVGRGGRGRGTGDGVEECRDRSGIRARE